MLRKIVDFFHYVFVVDPAMSPVERWAVSNAKLTTPDGIIAEHIVQKIAKNFDDWVTHRAPADEHISYHLRDTTRYKDYQEKKVEWYRRWTKAGSEANYHMLNRVLENKKLGIRVAYQFVGNDTKNKFYINDVKLTDSDGIYIVDALVRIESQLAEAKRVAEQATKAMKENEVKWNLVEKLSGMVRDANGALVPKENGECSQSTA